MALRLCTVHPSYRFGRLKENLRKLCPHKDKLESFSAH